MALAPTLLGLLALLTVFGTSLGTYDISMNTQGVAIERGYGPPIMAALHGAYSVGVLTGALGGSIAARAGLPPLAHFAIATVTLLIINGLGTRTLLSAEADMRRPAQSDSELATHGSQASHVARRVLLAVSGVAFCAFFAEGSVDDWSGVYLREVQHASFAAAPLGAAACGRGWRSVD